MFAAHHMLAQQSPNSLVLFEGSIFPFGFFGFLGLVAVDLVFTSTKGGVGINSSIFWRLDTIFPSVYHIESREGLESSTTETCAGEG